MVIKVTGQHAMTVIDYTRDGLVIGSYIAPDGQKHRLAVEPGQIRPIMPGTIPS